MGKIEKPFSALVVRNLESSVKRKLQQRARKHGHSMEQEVRDILRGAVAEEQPRSGLGSEIAALFAGIGFDEPIEEMRGFEPQPVDFGE